MEALDNVVRLVERFDNSDTILIYGVGGLLAPFFGIKLVDIILVALG